MDGLANKSGNRWRLDEHFFIKPEITVYPKERGDGGGFPLTFISHEEEDKEFDFTRRKKGIGSLFIDVISKAETKKLRDNMAYFVVDFKIRGDHPACGAFLDKIQAKLLTFIDENKTKALVSSQI